jgi:Mala s 1-like protein
MRILFSAALLSLLTLTSTVSAQSLPSTIPSFPTGVVSPAGITHTLLLHSPLQGKTYKIAPSGGIAAQYPTGPKGEDSWLLPNGRILASYSGGVREFDPATNSITWEYHAPPGSEIHSCQPLPGDRVLICECGSKRLFEIYRDLSIAREIRLASTQPTHKQFRLARKTDTNTYLVAYGSDAVVRELDAAGNTLQTYPLPPRKNAGAHGAFRLPNGHTLITGGYGLEAYEFDQSAHIIWSLTPSDLPKSFHLHYIGSASRLKNGNTLFTNFQGQPSLFEITPDKHVVWQYQNDAIGPISDCMIFDE